MHSCFVQSLLFLIRSVVFHILCQLGNLFRYFFCFPLLFFAWVSHWLPGSLMTCPKKFDSLFPLILIHFLCFTLYMRTSHPGYMLDIFLQISVTVSLVYSLLESHKRKVIFFAIMDIIFLVSIFFALPFLNWFELCVCF